MANKKITQLPDSTAVPFDPEDLILLGKYVSPGVYETSNVKFSSMMDYIQNLDLSDFTTIGHQLQNYDKIIYSSQIENCTAGVISGGNAAPEYSSGFHPMGLQFNNLATGMIKPFQYDFDVYIYGINCPYLKIINYKSIPIWIKSPLAHHIPSGLATLPSPTSTYTVTNADVDYTLHGDIVYTYTNVTPVAPEINAFCYWNPSTMTTICNYRIFHPLKNTLWFSHTSLPDTPVEVKIVTVSKLYQTLLF